MKFILNMYHCNDVMYMKFGQAGFGSARVTALELIENHLNGP